MACFAVISCAQYPAAIAICVADLLPDTSVAYSAEDRRDEESIGIRAGNGGACAWVRAGSGMHACVLIWEEPAKSRPYRQSPNGRILFRSVYILALLLPLLYTPSTSDSIPSVSHHETSELLRGAASSHGDRRAHNQG
jgi:hypothetical protein